MTATSLSTLPLAAGGALASSAGRASLWTLNKFLANPLNNSGLIAMVALTALAASNALYHQSIHHPKPLFAPVSQQAAADVPAPVMPAVRRAQVAPQPAQLPQVTSSETTGSVVQVVIPAGPVGNEDVYQVQKRLSELGLFQGTVDGYYGPNTAKAIRAFEDRNGFRSMGAMSPAIVDAIVHSDDRGMAQPQAAVVPVPVAPQPMAAIIAAPAPLVQQQAMAAPLPQGDRVIARLPEIQQQDQFGDTLNAVADSAEGTIDSIVASVDGGRKLPAAPAIAPIPAAAVGVAAQPVVQPLILPPVQVASAPAIAPAQQPTSNADVNLTTKVQRGLASLGFLQGPIDGHTGDATARAIREFEVYYNYPVTGQISPQLLDTLVAAGASV